MDGRPDQRRIHGGVDSERCDADDDIPKQDFLLGDMTVEHFARGDRAQDSKKYVSQCGNMDGIQERKNIRCAEFCVRALHAHARCEKRTNENREPWEY